MSRKTIKKFRYLSMLLLLFIIADSCYSFYQYYHLPLDGDMAPIVAPSAHYASVLQDPFGIAVVKDQATYAATNRYFAHITMIGYYKNFHSLMAPLFKDKVKALYSITALFNTVVQLFLLFMLTIYVCGHLRFWSTSFLLAAALILPFFQVNGLYESIGMIDKSVTYTFFYALPMALLMLFFLPFYLSFYHQKTVSTYLKKYMYPIWLALAIYLAFSGSQIAPLVIIICPSTIFIYLSFNLRPSSRKNLTQNFIKSFHKISKTMLFFFGFIVLLSLYSFYIGRFNIENGEPMALSERYWKLLLGLPQFLTYKITFVLMAALLFINFLMIKKFKPKFLSSLEFKVVIIAFTLCAVYIMLLPLGGYRPYRPWIVRYDTFLPVTIVLVILCTFSSHYLLSIPSLPKKMKTYYAIFLISILAIFQFSDQPFSKYGDNQCQKDALYTMAATNEKVIELSNNCTILSWSIMEDPQYSKDIGKMLFTWGITQEEIMFYQTINN